MKNSRMLCTMRFPSTRDWLMEFIDQLARVDGPSPTLQEWSSRLGVDIEVMLMVFGKLIKNGFLRVAV